MLQTVCYQKWLKIGTNRIKASSSFLPEGQKKSPPKPSAGARSKPTYEKAECCPNTNLFLTLPIAVNLSFGKHLSKRIAKNPKGPRKLGKYNSRK